MASDTFDPWQLASGLVDDCDVVIKDAYFAFDPQYNNGETLLLKWEVTTDDADTPETTIMFSTGSGWETRDKGATAVREDGKQKGFSKQSGIGMLVSAAIECGAGDVLKSRGTPMEAAMWKGLSFHMKRKTVSFGGDIKDTERMLPTEFKGDGGSGTSNKAATSNNAPTTVEAGTNGGGGLSAKLKVDLMKLAKDCADHDTFVERAFTEVAEVNGNADAEQAVMDPGGIWAKVHSTP